MRRPALCLALVLSALSVWTALAQPGVAYLAVDLKTGRQIASSRLDVIDAPLLPGSILKVATLAAALESGTITERTGVLCLRTTRVAGQSLTCAHPDLHRPLRAAEALAYSCNTFFASIAGRLPRAAFDRVLRDLGLPPAAASTPLAAEALGIDGIRATPRQLLSMIDRVTKEPSTLRWKPETLRVVRDGLRDAAHHGTASALEARGISAMAKTGTVVAAGVPQGMVAGVTPAIGPNVGFVLVASGAAGLDAAALAAERLGRTRAVAPGAAAAQVASGRGPVSPAQGASPPPRSSNTIRVGETQANGTYRTRTISLEDYVAGVVAGEASPQAPAAALEALAITVRTFAMANRGRHAADGFDLCDLTHCQVMRPATAASTRAAAATAGRVLLDKGAPARVYYSASCGGYTERPSQVWSGAADSLFLPSRHDDACGGEPLWSSELPAGDLLRALRAAGFKGETLRGVAVAGRNQSGRVVALDLDGLTPHTIAGPVFHALVGRSLGWQHLKSTAFDVHRTGSGYRFSGRGMGHGVGLCVLGSTRLAARGQTAESILARYFPGLALTAAAEAVPAAGSRPDAGTARPRTPEAATARPPAVRLFLPSEQEQERERFQELVVGVRDRLASALSLPVSPEIVVRVHPTVESYQRATKMPWYTAGATIGSEVHMLPIPVLRRRNQLEQTVRHEMVHVLTASLLASKPKWLIEGAASYFEDPDAMLPGRTQSASGESQARDCPADAEFERPSSPAALAAAYVRARRCFERLASAGPWLR